MFTVESLLIISVGLNIALLSVVVWCIVKWPATLTITNIKSISKPKPWTDKTFGNLLFSAARRI